MAQSDWAAGVDIGRPSAARIYDYLLGGSHNFAVDREAAEQVLAVMPSVRYMAESNRAFLYRAVRYLCHAGVRQFLDIGSGIPTSGSVHEIAQEIAPDSRVVYVDIDPIAIAHCTALLRNNDNATAILADARKPSTVLDDEATRDLLDFRQPVGLLIVSLLHFIPGEDAYQMVGSLGGVLPGGSYLVLSHAAPDPFTGEEGEALGAIYNRSTTPGGEARNRDEVMRFFEGYDLVEPGLAWATEWRPDEEPQTDPAKLGLLAGVGRKRG
jgi:hypothetical protein